MSDPRAYHVGVLRIDAERRITFDPLCEFPADAEHVHVTRHPDGTLTATPMRLAATGRDFYSDCRHLHLWEIVQAWVDCPTGGDHVSDPTTQGR